MSFSILFCFPFGLSAWVLFLQPTIHLNVRKKGEKKIFNYLVQVFHLSLVCFQSSFQTIQNWWMCTIKESLSFPSIYDKMNFFLMKELFLRNCFSLTLPLHFIPVVWSFAWYWECPFLLSVLHHHTQPFECASKEDEYSTAAVVIS